MTHLALLEKVPTPTSASFAPSHAAAANGATAIAGSSAPEPPGDDTTRITVV
jgi:hypothetical protein